MKKGNRSKMNGRRNSHETGLYRVRRGRPWFLSAFGSCTAGRPFPHAALSLPAAVLACERSGRRGAAFSRAAVVVLPPCGPARSPPPPNVSADGSGRMGRCPGAAARPNGAADGLDVVGGRLSAPGGAAAVAVGRH